LTAEDNEAVWQKQAKESTAKQEAKSKAYALRIEQQDQARKEKQERKAKTLELKRKEHQEQSKLHATIPEGQQKIQCNNCGRSCTTAQGFLAHAKAKHLEKLTTTATATAASESNN
jgi:ubiquitin C-terminal hydrolase